MRVCVSDWCMLRIRKEVFMKIVVIVVFVVVGIVVVVGVGYGGY